MVLFFVGWFVCECVLIIITQAAILLFAPVTAVAGVLKALVTLLGTPISFFIKGTNTLDVLVRYVAYTGRGLREACRRPLYDFTMRRGYVNFEYDKLQDPNTMIRLLKIERTEGKERVYKLVSRGLDKVPSYVAISYTWGSSSRTCAITMCDENGKLSRLPITENSYKVLEEGVSVWDETYLWIDSICINQMNNRAEKECQVDLMDEIYGGAKRVIVWLGTAPDAALARTALRKISRNLQRHSPNEPLLRNPVVAGGSWNDQELYAFMRFMRHPYFTRVWIVQEVALATEVQILYGGWMIEWDQLASIVRAFQNPDAGTLLPVVKLTELGLFFPGCAGIRNGNIICGLRSAKERGELIKLEELMMVCCMFEATQPRDKIYAFRGLSTKASRGSLKTDYRHSTLDQDIFRHTMESFLCEQNSLEFLSLAGIGYDRNLQNLPSWVPDLTCPPSVSCLNQVLPGEDARAYRASLDSRPNIKYDSTTNSHQLSLEGILVDRIRATNSRFRILPWSAVTDSSGKWHRSALELALGIGSNFYRSGEPLEEAFWRTLICNRTAKEFPAPQECGEAYRAMEKVNDARTKALKNIFAYIHSFRAPFTQDEAVLQSMREFIGDDSAFERKKAHLKELHVNRKGQIFEFDLANSCAGRRFAVTDEGYMAIVPPGAKAGDYVCVFLGARTPFVIRPCEIGGAYAVVGDCYVHGAMLGELMGQKTALFSLV